MEITINGTLYDSRVHHDCKGCAFERDVDGCDDAINLVNCSYENIIWKAKANEPVTFLTKAEPVKVTTIDAPVDQKPGTKYDDEKIQYTLIPPFALQEAARNLTVGLRKYKERDNWKKVENAEQRYMDAIYRHIEAVRRGEIYDTESGAENMPHLAAVVVNAMFVLEFMLDPKLKKGTE